VEFVVSKIIYGSKNEEIIVDDEDYDYLSKFNWNCYYFYARTFKRPKETNKLVGFCMHNMIMKISSKTVFVDHINGNTLDNRKENLRLCSPTENCYNKKRSKNNTTGFKGVVYHKRDKKFQATVKFKGKTIYLGYFNTAEEAGEAYDKKALELFGEYSNTNFKTDKVK
jgi:hypothetical protein